MTMPGVPDMKARAALRVLVVDDEEDVPAICRRVLARAGYDVEAASSGEEAVARLGEDFDIVLTDLSLGGQVDGNELTRRVRGAGSADVIIMTGDPRLETAVEALRDGAYDYLFKPFTRQSLLHAMGRCADKRRLSQELAREKQLSSALEAAYQQLERMEKLRETLGQFATPEVAQYVLDHPEDYWRRGERRRVTMLFADVRRFTPFASQADPEEVVQALNEIFLPVIEAVREQGGIVNKFIGDGVMALFGAPVPLPEQAGAAVRAALGALSEVEALGCRRQARGQEALAFGIGINTGDVVAGCLGTKERTEFSVIGHAVNLAARLQEAAGPGEILIGPESAARLAGRFILSKPRSLSLAGIAEPFAAVAVLRDVEANAHA